MPEKLVQRLCVLYREVLRDYEDLLAIMKEFDNFLNVYDQQNLPDGQEKTNDIQENPEIVRKRENCQPGGRTEYIQKSDSERDESPTSISSLKVDEGFEQQSTRVSAVREKIFKRLQERAHAATELQQMVCARTESLSFRASALKPYLQPALYKEITFVTESVNTKMTEVLKMDERIIPRIKMELEAVKLELHRLQGAKKMKNAYESQVQREARFIDKTK